MKLREVGLLTDDKHTLEMLEFGQADKIFQDNLLHERKAYKENEMIKENPEIQPGDTEGWIHPLEEKQVHAVIHSRLIFGEAFERLNPNQQQTINEHAMQTVQQLQEEQEAARQAELDMAAKAKAVGLKMEGGTPQG
jgi:predicted methyltransferase